MDKKIKAKWIKALESGKYKQTRHNLKDQNGYCCLGVLCDVLGTKWVPGPNTELFATGPSGRAAEEDSTLPKWALRKAGLRTIAGADAENKLIQMNDGKNLSFKQIAKWIKENL